MGSGIPDPGPGVKRAPDPGSGSATLSFSLGNSHKGTAGATYTDDPYLKRSTKP